MGPCVPVFKQISSELCICVCRFVVNEMIQSEKDYVKDLGVIVEVSLNAGRLKKKDFKMTETAQIKWNEFNLHECWWDYISSVCVCVCLRASCPGWRSEGFQRTWEEKTRSSSATSSRSTTGTASPSHTLIKPHCFPSPPRTLSDSLRVFSCSFFLVELDRCVQNHDLLADLFIRHVSDQRSFSPFLPFLEAATQAAERDDHQRLSYQYSYFIKCLKCVLIYTLKHINIWRK